MDFLSLLSCCFLVVGSRPNTVLSPSCKLPVKAEVVESHLFSSDVYYYHPDLTKLGAVYAIFQTPFCYWSFVAILQSKPIDLPSYVTQCKFNVIHPDTVIRFVNVSQHQPVHCLTSVPYKVVTDSYITFMCLDKTGPFRSTVYNVSGTHHRYDIRVYDNAGFGALMSSFVRSIVDVIEHIVKTVLLVILEVFAELFASLLSIIDTFIHYQVVANTVIVFFLLRQHMYGPYLIVSTLSFMVLYMKLNL